MKKFIISGPGLKETISTTENRVRLNGWLISCFKIHSTAYAIWRRDLNLSLIRRIKPMTPGLQGERLANHYAMDFFFFF